MSLFNSSASLTLHYLPTCSTFRSLCSSPFDFSLFTKLPLSSSRFAAPKRFGTPPVITTTSFRCSMALEIDSASSVHEDNIQGSLSYSRAYWPSKDIIAWNIDIGDGSCYLYASKTAALTVTDAGIQGHDVKIQLEKDNEGLPAKVIEKFPHIRGYTAFKVPSTVDTKSLLKCQLAVASYNSGGGCRNATGLQLPGVIDELYSYDGPLGATFSGDSISLYLWAPTAQTVTASLFKNPSGGEPFETVPLKESNGVWSISGPRSWEGCYYVYEVDVYHYSTLKIEKCFANDPYARGVSADGSRTLLVDINSDSLKPEGWDNLANEKPVLLSLSDISIYELHIRDFSANDLTVDSNLRGGYLAFAAQDSAGILHLKKLSAAGLTHVHLLPSFHFAEVNDDKEKWKFVDPKTLESLPSDSEEQQARITAIQDEDGYNWGYNPVLWGAPKGSYATNPNGPSRIIEFRKMVQALNHIGLRVVLDVVYNHLSSSGPHDQNSVLDKIVPGYYLRRDADGSIESSTCMNDTASEHYMVERLILDDLSSWAVNYKVDGFRFDLMGHIMKHTMVRATSMLQGLSKGRDGVEGSSIYLYGEGWDFGEVAKNARGVNASQLNLGGTGIGSFNDRIRDAMLGGGPFGPPLQQGFATGLSLEDHFGFDGASAKCPVISISTQDNGSEPNDHDHGSKSNEDRMLAVSKDHIQVGMAANLRDYVLTNCDGKQVRGSEVYNYDGSPVGYALQPIEIVNYVSAHDNETLFDIISLKTPINMTVDVRCRMNHIATSIIALSQGTPFFHAGDEMLRSKSLDRDSYNSGDWFNRLDFTYNSNNWGVGLPPKSHNENNWPLIRERLANPSYKPDKNHIVAAVENFTNLLQIRYSSPLFRLRTVKDIQDRVRFHNNGPSGVPGVIVMSIEDGRAGASGLSQLDPKFQYIVVIINVRPNQVSLADAVFRGKALQLHPVQVASNDIIVKESKFEPSSGCFTIPPKTTAVFAEPRHN